MPNRPLADRVQQQLAERREDPRDERQLTVPISICAICDADHDPLDVPESACGHSREHARMVNVPVAPLAHVRRRVLQEAAADPEVVERLARVRWEARRDDPWPPGSPHADILRESARKQLEAALLNVCPICHGEGEVQANRSRDPQEAYEERCGRCGGTGVAG